MSGYEATLKLNLWRKATPAELAEREGKRMGDSVYMSGNTYPATAEGVEMLLTELLFIPMEWTVQADLHVDGQHVGGFTLIDPEDRGRDEPAVWKLSYAHPWLYAESGKSFMDCHLGKVRGWIDVPKSFGLIEGVEFVQKRATQADEPAWWPLHPTVFGWKVEHNFWSSPFPSLELAEAWLAEQREKYASLFKNHVIRQGSRLSPGRLMAELDVEKPIENYFDRAS